ncbi:hypothetical protein HY449_02735 [Candidatus Pacearchaeota archaeon]|nr:hypothetical protein [Candidatus Pacearchaeota archaeon]
MYRRPLIIGEDGNYQERKSHLEGLSTECLESIRENLEPRVSRRQRNLF